MAEKMRFEVIYRFSPEEQAVVRHYYDQYLNVVRVIAQIHGLSGDLLVSPDLEGLGRLMPEQGE